MKKRGFLTYFMLNFLLLALCLAACGGPPAEGLGVYTCVRAEAGGNALDPEALFPAGLSLELGSGGKGILTLDGERGAVRWSLEGENLRLETGGSVSLGSLRDGVLTLDLLDAGLRLTFTAQGVEPPPAEPGPLDSLLGDWQGWWELSQAGGAYSALNGQGRACSAAFVPAGGEEVLLLLWDEDSSREEPAAWARFRPGEGAWAENSAGALLGMALEPGAWQLSEKAPEEGFALNGRCQDDAGGLAYSLQLEKMED